MMVSGLLETALSQVNLSQEAQGVGLAGPVADLAGQRQGLPEMTGGQLVSGLAQLDVAQVGQRPGLIGLITGLPAQCQRLCEMLGGLLVAALLTLARGHAAQHHRPMTWTAPEVARAEPPTVAGERESLESWLDYHRATLLFKCQGLTAEQLARRAVPPSSLSLLGLVRHMAEVERGWFRRGVGGQPDAGLLYCTDEAPDGDFDLAEPGGAQQDLAAFAAECVLAREAAAGKSLDGTFTRKGRSTFDVRWVYQHMIEEYARHNGHADFLRERIDGVTGD